MPKTGKPAPKKKQQGKGGFIAAIIVNLVLLFIFNSLMNWHLTAQYLTSDYSGVLWAINLSIGLTIIANIIYLVYDKGWFRHLSQIILSVVALFVVFLIYSVFPFAFETASWSHWVKITLIIIMAGIGIAIIVELFKLILRKD